MNKSNDHHWRPASCVPLSVVPRTDDRSHGPLTAWKPFVCRNPSVTFIGDKPTWIERRLPVIQMLRSEPTVMPSGHLSQQGCVLYPLPAFIGLRRSTISLIRCEAWVTPRPQRLSFDILREMNNRNMNECCAKCCVIDVQQ